MSAEELLARVRELAGERIRATAVLHGEAVATVGRDDAPALLEELRDRSDLAFNFLMDLTCVDYLGETPRFEVVYQLYSLAHGHRFRLKIRVPEDDPWVHTATGLWNSANWLEREAWDMFGVRFVGHPDPRRILMYEEFVGHPLRKDYPYNKRQPLTHERDPIALDWKFHGKR